MQTQPANAEPVTPWVASTALGQALTASGLLGPEGLRDLARHVVGEPPGPDADAELAELLIARGLLNRWQVDQLRSGRTKFTLGPYWVFDTIGKGGMGHLFKGRHTLLGRVEAIKVLPKTRTNSASVAQFLHEARAQASLDHPNLVRVCFAGEDRGTYYLVSEFVPGVDLRRLVRRGGPLTAGQAALVLRQAADALNYAHRRGLVHRDVKPGNLLVTPDARVKVTDLGLAWRLNDSPGDRGGTRGKVVGTSDYLAPESIHDPGRIIPVSDLYALGCTLYYAATGKVPFPGGNNATKMRRQIEEPAPDPRLLAPGLPSGLADLIADLMAKDHRRRVPSAAAAAERLEPFIDTAAGEALASLVQRAAASNPARSSGCRAAAPSGAAADLGETLVSESGCSPSASGAQAQTSGNVAPPPAGRPSAPQTYADPLRLVAAAAVGATLAIVIASIMGRL